MRRKSFFKKTEQVVFSVSNSEGDTNKGSFLKPDSVCYSYILDDWNTYKATFINDYTLKIECWYRHSTFRSLHYSYDVSVVDIRKIDNDFEWTDDDHNSFTVTLKDSENRDVKKGKFVTFEIDK